MFITIRMARMAIYQEFARRIDYEDFEDLKKRVDYAIDQAIAQGELVALPNDMVEPAEGRSWCLVSTMEIPSKG